MVEIITLIDLKTIQGMVGVNEIFFQCSCSILLKVIHNVLKGKGKMNEEFLENKINRN